MMYISIIHKTFVLTELAPTHLMGWNSWNVYVCDDLTEEVIRKTARILIDSGLAAAGYQYVNIDGMQFHVISKNVACTCRVIKLLNTNNGQE